MNEKHMKKLLDLQCERKKCQRVTDLDTACGPEVQDYPGLLRKIERYKKIISKRKREIV